MLEECYRSALDEEKSFKQKELFYQIVQVYLENDLYPAVEKLYHDQIKYLNGNDCNQQALVVLLTILMEHEPIRAEK